MEQDRRKNECPDCGNRFLYLEGKEVCCTKCDWKGVAKRVEDHKLSTLAEIRHAWGL